jgi:hypothetical protein
MFNWWRVLGIYVLRVLKSLKVEAISGLSWGNKIRLQFAAFVAQTVQRAQTFCEDGFTDLLTAPAPESSTRFVLHANLFFPLQSDFYAFDGTLFVQFKIACGFGVRRRYRDRHKTQGDKENGCIHGVSWTKEKHINYDFIFTTRLNINNKTIQKKLPKSDEEMTIFLTDCSLWMK